MLIFFLFQKHVSASWALLSHFLSPSRSLFFHTFNSSKLNSTHISSNRIVNASKIYSSHYFHSTCPAAYALWSIFIVISRVVWCSFMSAKISLCRLSIVHVVFIVSEVYWYLFSPTFAAVHIKSKYHFALDRSRLRLTVMLLQTMQ